MSISLQKGQKVSLSKDNAGLSQVLVGLGWDEAPQTKGGFIPAQSRSTVMLQRSFYREESCVIKPILSILAI